MHASTILHRSLSAVLEPMHAGRRRVLLQAVDALVSGRRLTLTDLARSWPDAVWMHAPLKALDRLLSNAHLAQEVQPLHREMAHWLLRGPQPCILVDWTDLKGNAHGCVLRAAVPTGGRALTLYEQVYPIQQLSQPRVQRAFLKTLKSLLPPTVRPIIVTDAGFRSDWCRAVVQMGWHYVARIRNNTQVCACGPNPWVPCTSLFAVARNSPKDLGAFDVVKRDPMRSRLVLSPSKPSCTQASQPKIRLRAKRARQGAMEPWLLATSLSTDDSSAAQVLSIYRRRMQIEEAFRDLKSHRYGAGFEDSLTRKSNRITILLLLQTLAAFAAWIAGCAGTRANLADPMTRQISRRSSYSTVRRGYAWIRVGVLMIQHLLAWLRTPFESNQSPGYAGLIA